MKRLFPQAKETPILNNIKAFYSKIISASNSRIQYANSVLQFTNSVSQIVKSWAPEYDHCFLQFRELYKEIYVINCALADSERRFAEDINDIAERFAVIQRIKDEYEVINERYKQSESLLIDAMASISYHQEKPEYEKKQAGLEQKLKEAKENRLNSIDEKKAKLQEYILVKQKYAIFKTKKIKKAFIDYGLAIKASAEKEVDIYTRIDQVLRMINQAGFPQEASAQIESILPVPSEPINPTEAVSLVNELEPEAEPNQ